MKRLFKGFLILLGSVILLLVIVLIYFQVKGIPSYTTVAVDYHVESSPARVERGGKLVKSLCIGCHINRELGNLAGGVMKDAPAEFGMIYAPNITKDKEYGIGKWTDAELMYLLRTGIKKDGSYAPAYMAKLPNMSHEDVASIIAFLRSDDPLVEASPQPDMPCEPSLLTKMLSRTAWSPFPLPKEQIFTPNGSNPVELGRYLAVNLECFSCHSENFATNDFLNPEKSPGYFAGGNKPLNLKGEVMLTSNLTPDPETGIGSWSKEQFIRAVKSGQVDDGPALRYPMNPYVHLTDEEVGAIYEYLQTIPAIKNQVDRSGL